MLDTFLPENRENISDFERCKERTHRTMDEGSAAVRPYPGAYLA
jgi:hypothetical protein